VDWAADGKGLFVSTSVQGGAELLYVALHGGTQVLWRTHGGSQIPVRPSPDGRHLAIQAWTVDCNLWMMENF
jgi:Tol biopolymer transport system component